MRHHRALALLAIAAITGMTACGGDDTADTTTDATADTTAVTTTETTEPTAPATTHSGTHPGTTPTSERATTVEDGVLTIVLSDFAFGGLPESVPAGTKLAVQNISEAELHEVVAFRVHDAETRTAEELLALPEEELLAVVGPIPTTVLLAAPGAPQIEALGDGTLAEPGRYLVLCGIPTGVDPAEYLAAAAEAAGGPPDVWGGPPHFTHGMYADLIVE